MDKHITRQMVQIAARNTIRFLAERGVETIDTLWALSGTKHTIDPRRNEHIEVSLRSPDFSTMRGDLAYIVDGLGIPLNAKVNKESGYSLVIVKSVYIFRGYELFGTDQRGNKMQSRTWQGFEFCDLQRELQELEETR